jgi:hypothetical protein
VIFDTFNFTYTTFAATQQSYSHCRFCNREGLRALSICAVLTAHAHGGRFLPRLTVALLSDLFFARSILSARRMRTCPDFWGAASSLDRDVPAIVATGAGHAATAWLLRGVRT